MARLNHHGYIPGVRIHFRAVIVFRYTVKIACVSLIEIRTEVSTSYHAKITMKFMSCFKFGHSEEDFKGKRPFERQFVITSVFLFNTNR